MACSRDTENAEYCEYWALARQGINLLLNNKHKEAETLFLKYPNSLTMYSGYSFAIFMDALMTFEDDKLAKAILVLKEVEKRCTTESGWLKSLSQNFFGSGNQANQSLAEQLERQIILADSQVCIAILTFLQQDLSGYFKGGWVLRKAWKVYQKTYKEILTLHKEQIGELQLPDPVAPLAAFDEPSEMDVGQSSLEWDIPEAQTNGYSYYSKSSIPRSRSSNFTRTNTTNFAESADITNKYVNNTKNSNKPPGSLSMKKSISVTEALSSRSGTNSFNSARFNFSPLTSSLSFNSFGASLKPIFPGQNYRESEKIDRKTLERLMGAISFGHGLFQLGISLLPPSLNRLINFLGFTANRQNGISCLMYSRLGVDMRAPLSRLSLLWYHTIVRPFYAIDGTNVQAGVEAASRLIEESKKEFADSALFLFFDGRTSRLNSDIVGALTSFRKANENTSHREIKILCLHEIGWCNLIQLDYENAKSTFTYLKTACRWSKTFYGYLAAICIGASQDFPSYMMFDEFNTCAANQKSEQLGEFLRRRAQCCPKNAATAKTYSATYFKLLVFEMLYLWNSLASCSKEDIDRVISDCKDADMAGDEPRNGLSNLILGSCYTIQKDFSAANDSYRRCLQKRSNELHNAEDAHISAFAQHELGHILVRDEQTKEEGKIMLQQVSKYCRYDFEARLNVRNHNTLKRL